MEPEGAANDAGGDSGEANGLWVQFKIVKSKIEEETLSMKLDHPMTPDEITRLWEKEWGVLHASRLKFEAPENSVSKWIHRHDTLPTAPDVIKLSSAPGSVFTALTTAFRKQGWVVDVYQVEGFGKIEPLKKKNAVVIDPVLNQSEEEYEEEPVIGNDFKPTLTLKTEHRRKAFSSSLRANFGGNEEPTKIPAVPDVDPHAEEEEKRQRVMLLPKASKWARFKKPQSDRDAARQKEQEQEQERKAKEERERREKLEQERREKLEQERQQREREEQERVEQEELERLEMEELAGLEREDMERLEREEQARTEEQEKREMEEAANKLLEDMQRRLDEKAEDDPKARERLEKRRAREEATRKRREAMEAKKKGAQG